MNPAIVSFHIEIVNWKFNNLFINASMTSGAEKGFSPNIPGFNSYHAKVANMHHIRHTKSLEL